MPRVLFVTLGDLQQTEDFFRRFDPQASAIADPRAVLYEAFGLERAGLGQIAGPAAIGALFRALSKGNGVGLPVGDPMRLGGEFLVHGRTILLAHRAEHVGNHLPMDTLQKCCPQTTL